MSIASSLELFSLPDLFRLIDFNSKSGRLILHLPSSSEKANINPIYYIWFESGKLVAISDRLNYKGLITLIENRGWLSPLITKRLRTLCPPQMPLGTYLLKIKLLTPEQLKLIFQLQLHQVYQLFDLTSAKFRFDELIELQDRLMTLPWLEMTGESIKATAVTIHALRLGKNLEPFAVDFPPPNRGLKRLVSQPHLYLLSLEREVWNRADSTTPLKKIAQQLDKSVQEIQIVAFRLMMVGLVDDVFLSNLNLKEIDQFSPSSVSSINLLSLNKTKLPATNLRTPINKSLFSNFLEFLRNYNIGHLSSLSGKKP
jgi:hypothetical protein